MTPEGFYRITYASRPGVGICQHHYSISREEEYEIWSLMYAVPSDHEFPVYHSKINSTGPDYQLLEIGKRIPGMPRKLRGAGR